MAGFDDEPPQGLGHHGRRAGASRRGRAWCTPALALAALVVGMLWKQGLLIAAGLVLAGIAGHLFDPQR